MAYRDLKLGFLSAFLCILSFSFSAQSAVITKIKRSKSLIYIDGGKEDGFERNTKVCIYDESNRKIGCGRLRKVAKDKALVKVPRALTQQLKRGLFVRTEEMHSVRMKEEKSTFVFSPKLNFHYSIIPASSFYSLAGLEEADKSNRTVFQQEDKGPSGFSFFSGIELDVRVIDLSLGFDLMTLPPDIYLINFEGSQEAVETIYEFSNRFYLDYTPLRYHINVGIGIQATYHGVMVKLSDQTIVDDGTNIPELTYTQNLLTLAARIPISYEFLLKPVGFFLKLTPIISFYSLNLGGGMEYSADERSGVTAYPFKEQVDSLSDSYDGLEEDLKGALDFKHNVFSLDISVGFFMAI